MLPRSSLITALSAAALTAFSLTLPLAAHAQQTGCSGKNMLDELQARDAGAYASLRKDADATPNGKKLLWKIEHADFPDRPVSYLFGTLHVTDQRVMDLSPAVEEAFSVSRRIAFEVEDMSPERTNEAIGVMQNAMSPATGTAPKLEQLLAKAEATRATVVLAKSPLPKEWLPRLKPWVALVLASTSECEQQRLKAGKLTQDGEIARLAENRGAGSFGLESTEMQLGALAGLSEADQLALLKARLAAYDKNDDRTETLVQLYLARDIGAMWQLEKHINASVGAETLEAYRLSMLDDRSIRMRDRMLMHLTYGGVFMAVGAMHLPGEKGLVALLQDAGYKLTAIE
jgi:uncharacterized protein